MITQHLTPDVDKADVKDEAEKIDTYNITGGLDAWMKPK